MNQIQAEAQRLEPRFIKALARWAGVDSERLDSESALMIYLCAAAVWCWDRGDAHTCHAVATAALAERVACPPAFVRLYRVISMGRRPVSAKRIAKLKGDSLCMVGAIGTVGIARATIVGHEPLPRRDEIELRRYEKQLRKEAADRVGISVAVLERAVHDFRVLLREMAKKG